MERHIILEKAHSYDFQRELTQPLGCIYDRKGGFWKIIENEEPMMLGDNPENRQTKKCDIETGEDQKGE